MRRVVRTDADRKAMVAAIQATELSRPFVLEWKPLVKKRSIGQNNLYWKQLACLSQETGHTKEELHEYFSLRYLPWFTSEVMGRDISMRKSTKNLTTSEFSDYLDQINQEALSLGIFLPSPGSAGWDEFDTRYQC